MGKPNKPIATIQINKGLDLVESYQTGEELFNALWHFHKNNQTEINVTFGHKLFNWITNDKNKRMYLRCNDPQIRHFDKWEKIDGEIIFSTKTWQIIVMVKHIFKCA